MNVLVVGGAGFLGSHLTERLVAEGVPAAREVQRRAKDLGIDVPIIDFVCSVLDGAITPQEGVVLLMARDIGFET